MSLHKLASDLLEVMGFIVVFHGVILFEFRDLLNPWQSPLYEVIGHAEQAKYVVCQDWSFVHDLVHTRKHIIASEVLITVFEFSLGELGCHPKVDESEPHVAILVQPAADVIKFEVAMGASKVMHFFQSLDRLAEHVQGEVSTLLIILNLQIPFLKIATVVCHKYFCHGVPHLVG